MHFLLLKTAKRSTKAVKGNHLKGYSTVDVCSFEKENSCGCDEKICFRTLPFEQLDRNF